VGISFYIVASLPTTRYIFSGASQGLLTCEAASRNWSCHADEVSVRNILNEEEDYNQNGYHDQMGFSGFNSVPKTIGT
jgi:hypothetical protein